MFLVIYRHIAAAFSLRHFHLVQNARARAGIYSASDFALIDRATTRTRQLSRASSTCPYDLFIQQQLDLCQTVMYQDASSGQYTSQRSRFREHPRCTARFGEVISHAFTMASTPEERMISVMNAEAILRYTKHQTSIDCSNLVGNTLIEDMVQAITSPTIRKFRI